MLRRSLSDPGNGTFLLDPEAFLKLLTQPVETQEESRRDFVSCGESPSTLHCSNVLIGRTRAGGLGKLRGVASRQGRANSHTRMLRPVHDLPPVQRTMAGPPREWRGAPSRLEEPISADPGLELGAGPTTSSHRQVDQCVQRYNRLYIYIGSPGWEF